MSTEAAEPAIAQKGVWRLETPNGSMAPRSALDVLVDLNDRVTSGKVGEFQPIPLGFTPLDKTIGSRPPARRAPPDRRRPGHRQDDDGPPDGAQRGVGRPGQRPVHLLRARRAVPAQPDDRDGVGPRPPAPQDRRDQDPGRPQGDPRLMAGRGPVGHRSWPTTPACDRRSTGLPATARTSSCCAARRPPAPSTTSATSSASTASCRGDRRLMVDRRLHAEGAGHSRSRRPSRRRSPTWSTASRTSRCPRTCR